MAVSHRPTHFFLSASRFKHNISGIYPQLLIQSLPDLLRKFTGIVRCHRICNIYFFQTLKLFYKGSCLEKCLIARTQYKKRFGILSCQVPCSDSSCASGPKACDIAAVQHSQRHAGIGIKDHYKAHKSWQTFFCIGLCPVYDLESVDLFSFEIAGFYIHIFVSLYKIVEYRWPDYGLFLCSEFVHIFHCLHDLV